MRAEHQMALTVALEQARMGVDEGGMPFGAVLLGCSGEVLSAAHNRQLQSGRWLAHAEAECLNAILVSLDDRAALESATLVATEAPCPMCAGTAIICGISTVVVGESMHYSGALDWLSDSGIDVILAQDQRCIDLVGAFKADHPDRWRRFSAG